MNTIKSALHLGAQQKAQNGLCEVCGRKPRYVEKGFRHPYCSKTCARSLQATNPTACLLQGCRGWGKPDYAGFCSNAHQREAVRQGQVKGCVQCKVHPTAVDELCLGCDRRAGDRSHIQELDTSGSTFKKIKKQFVGDWKSPHEAPKVEKVYEIIVPDDVRDIYDAHRKFLSSVHETRTYHSSQCICDLGTKDAVLCDMPSCGICNIVRSSFKAFAFGVPHNTGRFGVGIYSYKNPGLADQFATSCTTSPFRVVIAGNVLVEVPDKVGKLSKAPASPVLEDSIFVPTASAIIPTYVIMYTK